LPDGIFGGLGLLPQVRLLNGWHHHMGLVMMAMLFMLTE
jgi:hypothetical protein